VHAAFDANAIATELANLGLDVSQVASQASSRRPYLLRPDLGRRLAPESAAHLAAEAGTEVVLVIGDGLSS
jgi:ethanolamine ammonia-lyase small subunit